MAVGLFFILSGFVLAYNSPAGRWIRASSRGAVRADLPGLPARVCPDRPGGGGAAIALGSPQAGGGGPGLRRHGAGVVSESGPGLERARVVPIERSFFLSAISGDLARGIPAVSAGPVDGRRSVLGRGARSSAGPACASRGRIRRGGDVHAGVPAGGIRPGGRGRCRLLAAGLRLASCSGSGCRGAGRLCSAFSVLCASGNAGRAGRAVVCRARLHARVRWRDAGPVPFVAPDLHPGKCQLCDLHSPIPADGVVSAGVPGSVCRRPAGSFGLGRVRVVRTDFDGRVAGLLRLARNTGAPLDPVLEHFSSAV